MRILDLQRNEMSNPIVKMAAAAAIAGAVVFDVRYTESKRSQTRTRTAVGFRKERSPPVSVRGTACSKHGWPNFEHSCQFDFRQPTNEAQTVRVIALR